MTDGMFFEQGYWTANQSIRRRLYFMGSALLWLVIPIADLSNQDPSGLEIAGAAVGVVAFALVFLDAAWRPVTHEDIARVVVRTGLALALAVTMTLTLVPSFALMFVLAAVGAGIRLPPRLGVPAVLFTTVLAAVSSALGAGDRRAGRLVGRHDGGHRDPVRGLRPAHRGQHGAARGPRRARPARRGRGAAALRAATCTTCSGTACRSSRSRPSWPSALLPDDPERAERAGPRDRERRARGAGRGARDGQRLPPADARGRAGGRAHGARGRRHRGRRSSERAHRAVRPRSRRCSRGRCARARRTSSATARRATRRSRILPGLVAASAEVVDDGRGADGGPPDGGHGLAGLRERAERLGGERRRRHRRRRRLPPARQRARSPA